jgi:hypothetical protein
MENTGTSIKYPRDMNQSIALHRSQWRSALLSGEFLPDSEKRLRWEGRNKPPTVRWSAFGVLCEVFRRDPGTFGNWQWLPLREGEHAFNDLGIAALGPIHIPPDKVKDWVGLKPGDFADCFWQVNQGKSFKEIAEWLLHLR